MLLSILILTSAEVGSRCELRRTSHRPRLMFAVLARRRLFWLCDNKLAHIKLPAMAAGGVGGNSGKTYSFKVVLGGEGCVGKTSLGPRYCENKFNDKHITSLQVRPVEPLRG